jgi:hypothetical protein
LLACFDMHNNGQRPTLLACRASKLFFVTVHELALHFLLFVICRSTAVRIAGPTMGDDAAAQIAELRRVRSIER